MTYSETLEEEILKKISLAEDQDSLEEIRIAELGKKGKISLLMKDLSKLSPEDRKEQGSKLNILKKNISNAISSKKNELTNIELEKRLLEEKIDITLPVQVNQSKHGKIHPVSQVLDEISEIFGSLGYKISEGPDIETEHYNFNALNIPEYHPARQMHDTFYLNNDNTEEKHVLRTHTSPVQVRTMEKDKPPFKFISPGRTYRCDSDQTHTPMFHQIEGLVVDEETHLGHLKWTLETFFKSFFELDNIEIQLRPSYFPFTEPSLEVDVLCDRSGSVLKIGEGSDWLEVAGAGMVHPEVLKSSNIDPNKYQGFAFGLGVDRLAQLKYGIPDLRTFFNGDIRWLNHYGFSFLDIPTLSRGLKK
jgi:phenylalanyl-tRNA synthetase alpha chain